MLLSRYPMFSWNGKRIDSIRLQEHIHVHAGYNGCGRVRGVLRHDVGVDANGCAPVDRDQHLDFFRDVELVQVGFTEDEDALLEWAARAK